MSHSTEQRHTAQQAQLDDLIAEARDATGILPTRDRCQEMHDQLRDVIRDLAEQVRRRLDRLATGTTEWARCEQALLQARDALTGSLGSGLRSAALHVQTLGEAAAVLDACMHDE
ncbi:DUF6415 family natural product biosynthesis protein [Streptomyces sp. NPDC005303]|uniref:DUF6415 family natural product biosynthesis protein n=1 Tax=Streptomyces sp. NPDC005303 TaxID=3155713 RepID=UPI0033A757E9